MPHQIRFILIFTIVFLSSIFIYFQRERITASISEVKPSLFNHPLLSSTTQEAITYNTTLQPALTKISEDATLDNLLRTKAQCDQDFPDLYHAIDTSVSHYLAHKPLTHADLLETFDPTGHTWVVIRNNQLYVRSRHGGFQSRVQAVLADLHRAIVTSPERLPDVEFLFNTADSAPSEKYSPVFGLSRALDERAFLIPDFGYWAWPEPYVNGFSAFEQTVAAREPAWEDKKPELFWRGAAKFNREREQLVEISNAHNDTWGNVRDIVWEDLKDGDRYDMADHCQFRFLAHVEGVRYSARLKYLQFCGSVIVTHERRWTTHLSHLLRGEGEEQNVVVVPGGDLAGLEGVMEALLIDEERARRVARNTRKFFGARYGRLGAEVCYWRGLVRGYWEVMDEHWRGNLSGGVSMEGVKDYESVMLMGGTVWDVA